MNDPYKVAADFARAFGEAEYAMKRSGILRRGKETAQADWNAFARNLGQDFFAFTVEKGLAKTLIGEPPRNLTNDLQWEPETPAPFTNVHDLIVKGVCRVRNNYLHGEKFRGGPEGQWARDIEIIKEAHAVLDAAMKWCLQAKS